MNVASIKHIMASTFAAMSPIGSMVSPNGRMTDKKLASSSNKLSSFASISSSSFGRRQSVALRRTRSPKIYAAKDLHFNKDGLAIKKLQVSLSVKTPIIQYVELQLSLVFEVLLSFILLL